MKYLIVLLILLLFYFQWYFLIKKKAIAKEHHKTKEHQIKKEWKKIRVAHTNCIVIPMDEEIEYKKTKEYEKTSFWKQLWYSDDPNYPRYVLEKRAKLKCHIPSIPDANFSKLLVIDSTLLQFKVKCQGYVEVYIPTISQRNHATYLDAFSEAYYIDTSFLGLEEY